MTTVPGWSTIANSKGAFGLTAQSPTPINMETLAASGGLTLASLFNVLTYGAVGDGMTDDTAAITAAAVAARNSGGGLVYIPAGVFITSGSLPGYTGVTYQGVGIDATIIRADVPFSYAIQFEGTSAAPVTNAGMADLTIDCQNVGDADAVLYQYVSYLTFDRVKMVNCAYKCVNFASLGRSVSDGVLNSTTIVTSASYNFSSANVGQPIYGIGIPAGTTILTYVNPTSVIMSQAATATATGVLIAVGFTATENDHIYFTDCQFTNQNQISPGNQEAITIGDVTTMRFTRCTWNTCYSAALAYQLANDISFDDCVVNGNTFYGFNLAISCKDITFRNTKVFGLAGSGNWGLFTGSVSDNGVFASTYVDRVKTVGCRFTVGYGGMFLAAVDDFIDLGSTIDTNHTSGVVIETSGGQALSQNVRFVGTEFRNNTQVFSPKNINAALQFNTPGDLFFKAIGCVFTDDQTTQTQYYPVGFQGTGTAGTSIFEDVVIDDCTLTPYSTGLSIVLVSAATLGQASKVSNCPLYNPVGSVIPGTAFALPATTVAWANTTGVDGTLYVTAAGTVTAVHVNGVAVQTSLAVGETFHIPVNGTFQATYSAAPTLVFVGE